MIARVIRPDAVAGDRQGSTAQDSEIERQRDVEPPREQTLESGRRGDRVADRVRNDLEHRHVDEQSRQVTWRDRIRPRRNAHASGAHTVGSSTWRGCGTSFAAAGGLRRRSAGRPAHESATRRRRRPGSPRRGGEPTLAEPVNPEEADAERFRAGRHRFSRRTMMPPIVPVAVGRRGSGAWICGGFMPHGGGGGARPPDEIRAESIRRDFRPRGAALHCGGPCFYVSGITVCQGIVFTLTV